MQIHQLYTHNALRNFTYLIEGLEGEYYCLDPFDADQVLAFLKEHKGTLVAVINTHEHWDHTQGNHKLRKETGCQVLAHSNGEGKIPALTRTLKVGEHLGLDDDNYLEVLDTPGHTFAHLCLLLVKEQNPFAVFTGDTLFNAGVGNCGNGGEPEVLFKTISEQFQNLDDKVLVYPGHEYLGNNLRFTLDREPANCCAKEWLERYQKVDADNEYFVTNMKDEREINTFLRLENEEVRKNLPNSPTQNKQVFVELRKLRNSW